MFSQPRWAILRSCLLSFRGRSIVGLACALAALGVSTLPALGQEQLWLRQFGTRPPPTFAWAAAPAGADGVYVVGATDGNLGGPHAGFDDAFLALYDSAGNRVWIRQFGTSEIDIAAAAAPDGAGGVFVAGWTSGSLGGPNAGAYDAFLARYDSAGNRVWIRQFGTSGTDVATAAAPDGEGGAYVAGWTTGSLGGPNVDPTGLTPDAYLARYDSAGNRVWIRQFGTSGNDVARAAAPDGAGGLYVAGYTNGSLGGPNAGCDDAFLARYDSAGNRVWIRQFGTSGTDQAYAAAADGAGGVYVAGLTNGSLDGPNAGGQDAYLARYDSAGNQVWIRQFGTSGEDVAYAAAPDGAGGVYVAGDTRGSLGGPNAGGADAYLARYDIAGNRVWIRQFGTSANDYAGAATPDGAGGVYVAGITQGSFGGPNVGNYDAFVARYVPCLADFNHDGSVNSQDFFDYLTAFFTGEPSADFNHDGHIDSQDFFDFVAAFFAPC